MGLAPIALASQFTTAEQTFLAGLADHSYTDGQLIIGKTSTGGIAYATLTAGSNITITNGSGTITIASSGGSAITVGTTTITSGTNTRVLYDNSGVVGEYTISGSGSVAMTTSPTFVTPTLGVASATSLATSAASPLLLTNGQLVTIALTSQTTGATTLTIPDFASVVDEFVFKTKSVTMSNKTFVAPVLGAATATSINGLIITATAGTLTIANNASASLITSGNFALTLTATNTTNSTFPAGTHTLAGLDVNQTWSGTQTYGDAVIVATTPKIVTGLKDTNGNAWLNVSATGSAVDGITITNAATANPATVVIAASGSDSNIHFLHSPKGTGRFQLSDGTDTTKILAFNISGATTGITGTFLWSPTTAKTLTFPNATDTVAVLGTAQTWTAAQTYGADLVIATSPKIVTNIHDTNGNILLNIGATASAVNYVKVTNAATGTAGPILAADGETNVDLKIAGKGTGLVHFTTGTYGDITADSDGATVTFNLATSNLHSVTLGGNRTLALSNSVVGQVFTIVLVQDGTGSRTVTWFSTIKWAAGTTPTLTTTINKADVFTFVCYSANNYYVTVAGQNF